MKYFLNPYECSYHLSLLPLNLCKYQNPRVIKESDDVSDFFHCFSFSDKLIKHFMKVVGNIDYASKYALKTSIASNGLFRLHFMKLICFSFRW